MSNLLKKESGLDELTKKGGMIRGVSHRDNGKVLQLATWVSRPR